MRLAAAGLLALLATPGLAQTRQLELGLEGFGYESRASLLNRENVLGLEAHPGLGRLALGWKQTRGGFRAVFRGYVERSRGTPQDDTRWVLRQGYLQYWRGETFGVRVGKQRVAWGSGLAWNPTLRLEPPKNALNTALEQEGALAARLDWAPRSWASLVLVGATSDATPRDLPLAAAGQTRRSAALRARVLVKDTDIAFVASGGRNQRTLFGLDLGRDVRGALAVHAEAALYRGSELLPAREGTWFLRAVAGALKTRGDDAFALEYFYNGEGYSDRATAAWLSGLELAWGAATNPALPPAQQQQALGAYAAGASLPYASGLGLRRHYLHASWTRGGATSVWTGALRAVVGLSDGGCALTPGIGYAPSGNLTLNLDAVLPLGPARSEYRLSPVRGALQARLRLLF